MEKFINDIKTFFFNLPTFTKVVIIAGLSICLAMAFIKFIKTFAKDKGKLKIGQILLIALLVGLIVLISIWSF